MLILAIRTDNPEAELCLLDEKGALLDRFIWHGHRQLSETIHIKIKELLHKQNKKLSAVSAIAVYKGPGSFTGLRIGVSIANALAMSLRVPVVGVRGAVGKYQQFKGYSKKKMIR